MSLERFERDTAPVQAANCSNYYTMLNGVPENTTISSLQAVLSLKLTFQCNSTYQIAEETILQN